MRRLIVTLIVGLASAPPAMCGTASPNKQPFRIKHQQNLFIATSTLSSEQWLGHFQTRQEL